MATRDLTEHFIRQRSALHRKAPGARGGDDGFGGSGLLAGGPSGGLDTAPLALSGASPMYVEMVNEITADMNGLQVKSACRERPPFSLAPHNRLPRARLNSVLTKRPPPPLPSLPPLFRALSSARSGGAGPRARPAHAHQL